VSEQNELPPKPSFRELPPVPFWGAAVTAPEADKSKIIQALGKSSEAVQFTYSGFFTSVSDGKTAYHFSRYPRHLFGIATNEQCQKALSELTKNLQSNGVEYMADTLSGVGLNDGFRVVLGLKEGYGEDAKVHDMAEIKEQLPHDVALDPADIYAVGQWGYYEEPAVIITGAKTHIPAVYQLADRYGQSRFTVEDMRQGTAYVVETRHCTDPDPKSST
jgi:hypothetical protein